MVEVGTTSPNRIFLLAETGVDQVLSYQLGWETRYANQIGQRRAVKTRKAISADGTKHPLQPAVLA